ncbi:uncharacterized protein LOC132744064 [Ruditapes philippinarum]|uniref:uncharacterized protein LOC132744064 n=1 Tax=Ruditapes philippinarum TaxID=129788 RepID=UPI00295BC27A|nr:uncharacterized protein LOC132744064 [Ruditapes philippinarum]
MESCWDILMKEDSLKKLSVYFGVPEENHWKSNYVSASTFFENKNGFHEHLLSIPTSAGFCSILRPDVVRLLSQNLSQAHTVEQRRMYRKETRKTGLGTASFELDKKPKIGDDFVNNLHEGASKEVKDKINMAYIAGLISNADKGSALKNKSTKEKSSLFLKYFLYALLAYFLYRQLSDMTVGPGNGGFPMVTPGRFEVNPEEVKVKFF